MRRLCVSRRMLLAVRRDLPKGGRNRPLQCSARRQKRKRMKEEFEYYPSGEISREKRFFEEGSFEIEEWKSFSLDGDLKESGRIHRKDGMRNGLTEQWTHNDGDAILKFKINYRNDKEDGLSEYWHNGKLFFKTNYKNGFLDGAREVMWDNGQLRAKLNYKHDKLEGIQEFWHPDGQPLLKAFCRENKREGLFECWYGNGQLFVRDSYKNGVRDGLYECWYPDGQLKSKCVFEKGVLVEECFVSTFETITLKHYDRKGLLRDYKWMKDDAILRGGIDDFFGPIEYIPPIICKKNRRGNLILNVAAGCIEDGLILKYRIDFEGASIAIEDGGDFESDVMDKLFEKISIADCEKRYGKIPDEIKRDLDLYSIELLRMPFFYEQYNGCVEDVLHLRYDSNGRSVIESNRPELLLPFMCDGGLTLERMVCIGERIHEEEGVGPWTKLTNIDILK